MRMLRTINTARQARNRAWCREFDHPSDPAAEQASSHCYTTLAPENSNFFTPALK